VQLEVLKLIGRWQIDQPQILTQLALLLADQAVGLRVAACEAVLSLGAKAATPAFDEPLRRLAGQGKIRAWRSLFWLAKSAASSTLLNRLTEELRHLDIGTRMTGVAVELGWKDAWDLEELLAELVRRLAHPEEAIRRSSVWALGLLKVDCISDDSLVRLANLLGHADEGIRLSASAAASHLDRQLARPVFLNRLPRLVTAEDVGLRTAAIHVLGILGSAAAIPGLLAAVEELLAGDNVSRWWTASEILTLAEGIVPSERIRNRIIELMYRKDSIVGQLLLTLLRNLAPRLDPSEFIEEVLALATVPDAAARLNAARALPVLEENGLLDGRGVRRLAEMLADGHADVSRAALEGLLALGPAHQPPDLPARIARVLRSPEKRRRLQVMEALDRLGDALVPAVLQNLWVQLLRDLDPLIRRQTALWLDRLVIPERDLLARLPGMLRDGDPQVRQVAVMQVARLGTRALQEEVPAALADLLSRRDTQGVWSEALTVLKGLGPALACPAFVYGLDVLLNQDDPDVLVPTIRAINQLGRQLFPRRDRNAPKCTTPTLLRRLLRLLAHRHADVRLEAARALFQHARAGDRTEVLRYLSVRITDVDGRVRELAVRAVRCLRQNAWTEPFFRSLKQALHVPDEGTTATAVQVAGRLDGLEDQPDLVDALAALHGRGTIAGVRAAHLLCRHGYRLLRTDEASGWRAVPLLVLAGESERE
jgi:HEAT repeat protein